MGRRILAGLLVGVCVVSAAAQEQDPAAKAAALWREVRRADADSAEGKAAQWKLAALIGTLPAAKRTAVATALMDGRTEASVNAAALELLGQDPLPITDVQRILWDPQRTWQQRELLKTYYGFCRAEAKASVLSEATRRQLVDVLAERLNNLVATKADYGEQRLLTHVTSAVLSRYARQADKVPQARGLTQALAKYADKAGSADGFGAAVPVWLDLASTAPGAIDTFGKAVQHLGHWDALARLKAAVYLGEQLPSDDKAARVVLAMLGDPRDEARAAAARVFAFAADYRPNTVIPRMVSLLRSDRGVVVQRAAADVLIARAGQATGQIEPLMKVFEDPRVIPGRKRTSRILLALSRLARYAAPMQKERLLRLAVRHLDRAPEGALAVMEALGPDAKKVVPSIREYRATADRFHRVYIDRQVLPAILPETAPKGP